MSASQIVLKHSLPELDLNTGRGESSQLIDSVGTVACWVGLTHWVKMDSSVRFVGGLGGLTPHWLKMTPTLVTENFCLGAGRLRPPVPIQQDQHND